MKQKKPVSTLPSTRSSSQMSAPATLMQEQDVRQASGAPWGLEEERQRYGREERLGQGQGRGQVSYTTQEQPEDAPLYKGQMGDGSHRHKGQLGDSSQRPMDIITMSELEDFAMESG